MTAAPETLIRVCVVSRDTAMVEEVHKDLLIGFLTRGGYDFESDHPDFQEYCDVLLLDLRPAGLKAAPEEGLAFIDAMRKSASHPPIVVLCEDEAEFSREVMRHGAYEKLTAPLNMPQLRLALQRAYDFRSAENKLQTFLSAETATHEAVRHMKSPKPRTVRRRIVRSKPAPTAATARRAVSGPARGPSRLAVGFVLGCVIFFAGLVAVRTILLGMGDALASAGLAADAGTSDSSNVPIHSAVGAHTTALASHRARTVAATADFAPGTLEGSNAALETGSIPEGYEPAYVIERVDPRYSADARARHLEGMVQIRALIGTDGTPTGLARVSGDPTLAQIAIDAISLWRYEPARVDGKPVVSEVVIPVEFQLPN